MANMNINIKKDETKRIEDLIKNEEETIKQRESDIKNDWELISNFMQQVSNKADQAQIVIYLSRNMIKSESLKMTIIIGS